MAKRRIGYQDGGDVMDDIGAGPPVLNPGAMAQPRQAGGGGRGLSGLISQGVSNAKQECMEDAVGRGSRHASAECADAGTFARGGPVGYANGGAIQPGADMNRRASLLAGLRKRYDAMIGMAQGALAHRDEDAAIRFAQRAHDMVPDGKSLILHVQPDGNVLAIVHDPRGGEHSRHVMTPDQFHHYLIGPATSFDHVIENGVGHNLGIATGRPTPRQPDHPADPIHKVRQVLQHTRKMFGVDKIGQAPPRVGYAVGGPVRVDDTLPPDPAWTTQDERDNPPPPDAPDDRQPLWEQFARKHFGYGDVPDVGTEPVPSDDEADRTPLYQQWAQKHLGPIKDTIASYLGGANAASPQEVDSTLQGVAEQNPGLTIPETVQRAVAEQNPSLNASGTTSGDDRTVGTGYGGAQTNQPSSNDNREEFFRRLMADRDKAVSQYVIQAPGSRAQSSSLLPETGLLSSTDTKTGKVTETPLGMRQREAAQTPSLHEFLNPKPAVAGALPAPPKMTGNKAVDEHNIAIWKEQAIAARGSISQQNAATAIQQRAATAAEAGMSRDAIAVLRNIQAKGGAETDDEKFVEREYTTRVRQNLEKMKGQGGGQAQAGGQQRVKVGSIAEARKLPSGTLITLPDGSPGQVP